jgi:predicted kinase
VARELDRNALIRQARDHAGMPENPQARSVKIGADERTGWSSERPRAGGDTPRPADISGRCRVLAPAFRLRYSPGSLLVIVGSAATGPVRFADRVVEERGASISLARVRALLSGRVSEQEIDARAHELHAAAVGKRLQAGETVVVPLEGFSREDRERFTRLAHSLRRPRHVILLDASRDEVPDEERRELDDMRRALDAGELGSEGFQTALRLGGKAREELKKIVFQPPPRED